MLRIFSCNLKLARLEDVVTLQDSWHVARCLARCKMMETFHNIVDGWPCDYFEGNFCPTHVGTLRTDCVIGKVTFSNALVTLLDAKLWTFSCSLWHALDAPLWTFSSHFLPSLDAMLRIFSCTLEMARLEDVLTLQDGWQVARYLERCKMSAREVLGWGGGGGGKLLYDTLHIVDEWPCDYFLGGGGGGGNVGWRRGK